MRLLLDTHTFLWFNLSDSRLSAPARNLIVDRDNQIMISPASYWELAIKISRGKYKLETQYEPFWQKGIDDNSFSILPIELRHTTALIKMPFHHSDPFDRLIVAQALSERVSLISSDATLDATASRASGNCSNHSLSF